MSKHGKDVEPRASAAMLSRRTVIGFLVAGAAPAKLLAQGHTGLSSSTAWQRADHIQASIQEPTFPDREFIITQFGAVANSNSDASKAIADAIAACNTAGGGRVVIPAGEYLCGPIHMLSNVNLHLAADAVLSFDTNPDRYLPLVLSRWEGMDLMNYSPLIYANGQENIAITGSGTIQGNADKDTWWPWKGKVSYRTWKYIEGQDQAEAKWRLQQQVQDEVPVTERRYGKGSWLRPPLIQTYECRRVLIQGVTLRDSPFWMIHPVLSEDVTVRDVHCISHGPNSDGCNPESCNRVLIERCTFDSGDDCIAIKSGRNADGRRRGIPSQNIVIRDCVMKAGHGGVVIGSEVSGGVQQVYVERCTMSSPDLQRAIRIKTNSARGGFIDQVYLRDIRVGTVQAVLVINLRYDEDVGDVGDYDPVVRNIEIQNLDVDDAKVAFYVMGLDGKPIQGLSLEQVRIRSASKVGVIKHVEPLALKSVTVNGEAFTRTSR